MTGGVFGNAYASAYDDLYADKGYEVECDLLEAVSAEHADGSTRSVLDLACRTGGHACLLAQRGYEVAGVNASTGMLTLAREKVECLSSPHPVSSREVTGASPWGGSSMRCSCCSPYWDTRRPTDSTWNALVVAT